jgi:sulfide:quinone oxidoreductase
VNWVKDMVAGFDPAANTVVTAGGSASSYDFLVVATGVHLDYAQIEGMDVAAIGRNGLASVYPSPQAAQATWAGDAGLRAEGRQRGDDAAGHAAEVRRRAAEDDLHAARPAAAGRHAGLEDQLQSALGNVFGVKVVNDNVLARWKTLGIDVEYTQQARGGRHRRAPRHLRHARRREAECPTTSSTWCRRCARPTR